MGSASLAFRSGVDSSLYPDCYFIRQSIFNGLAKKDSFYYRPAVYSQSRFQLRLYADSVRPKKQSPRGCRYSACSRHTHLGDGGHLAPCPLDNLYQYSVFALGWFRHDSSTHNYILEPIADLFPSSPSSRFYYTTSYQQTGVCWYDFCVIV